MITYHKGSIFDSEAYALVNPVNCVGIMGKGLALEFRKRYPLMAKDYGLKCKARYYRIGQVDSFEESGKLIVNFPTKEHWRDPSLLSYIKMGLGSLLFEIHYKNITSIALPKLGCGLGGLFWADVKPLIELHLGSIKGVNVEVYQ